jgi:hypothetical protein
MRARVLVLGGGGAWPPAYHPTCTTCRYLKQQLAKHGVQTLVPESEADLSQIFQLIMDELGFNIFKDDTRAFFVAQVKLCSGVLTVLPPAQWSEHPFTGRHSVPCQDGVCWAVETASICAGGQQHSSAAHTPLQAPAGCCRCSSCRLVASAVCLLPRLCTHPCAHLRWRCLLRPKPFGLTARAQPADEPNMADPAAAQRRLRPRGAVGASSSCVCVVRAWRLWPVRLPCCLSGAGSGGAWSRGRDPGVHGDRAAGAPGGCAGGE